MNSQLADVTAVVVHHRSVGTIAATVRGLLDEGILAPHLVVVDNSEHDTTFRALIEAIDTSVQVISVPNRGYAAAVNAGVRHLRVANGQFTLVATHESRPLPGAVSALREALRALPAAAVAGPTLINDLCATRAWSTGGYRSRWLNFPLHRDAHTALDDIRITRPCARAWLDGAFLLYTTAALENHPMDEKFMLYFEEVEHHARLQRHGYECYWVPEARAYQSSSGMPPYWSGRNYKLFQASTFGSWRSAIMTAAYLLRSVTAAMKTFDFPRLVSLLRGATAPTHGASVLLVNPLAGALHHYEQQLTSTIEAAGHSCVALGLKEPSLSGQPRLLYLVHYLAILMRARLQARKTLAPVPILVLWPLLHYWDIFLVRILAGPKARIVFHDPRPLVSTAGSGRVARILAARVASGTHLVVHSQMARDHLASDLRLNHSPSVLPLPILDPVLRPTLPSQVRIRVLGQYKPDRDLRALAAVAAKAPQAWDLAIMGRGWPDIPSWRKVDRFLTEDEFTQSVQSASVVLVPYSRFYQSAVATRCLEAGVPVSGPIDSTLAELHSGDKSNLASNSEDYPRAVSHAMTQEPVACWRTAVEYRRQSIAEYAEWVRAQREK